MAAIYFRSLKTRMLQSSQLSDSKEGIRIGADSLMELGTLGAAVNESKRFINLNGV
ncbi:hypothetical protein ACI2J4_21885 [Agrobacterium tumefaciens]|uniref:hypothetical protein n=1 Tax=Agrobacterium tumefaciens TaxID=358 RepID=UPI0012DA4C12|nr:hypothetical protein [Agrobacterium tumefaciens]QTK78014.1 hypothetical protein AT6N2_C0044 [Agrobacterium tumefaciens]